MVQGGGRSKGTVNNPLAVVINLGELGPSNTASFVKAVVPLKLRSNAAYILSMSATVTGSAATANRLTAADIGFGLGGLTRTGTGVATGTDTNQTAGDPTTLAAGDATTNATTGRWEYLATKSDLADFAVSTPALNGPQIMNAVPRSNTNGLVINSIFAVKPQFYENGTTSVAVTFTATAP